MLTDIPKISCYARSQDVVPPKPYSSQGFGIDSLRFSLGSEVGLCGALEDIVHLCSLGFAIVEVEGGGLSILALLGGGRLQARQGTANP